MNLLGSIGIVEQDLHSLRVQVFKLHMGDAVRLQVTVKDLKQVRAAAGQHCAVRHQFMTTHLGKVKSMSHPAASAKHSDDSSSLRKPGATAQPNDAKSRLKV